VYVRPMPLVQKEETMKEILLVAIISICTFGCSENPEVLFNKMINNPNIENGMSYSRLYSYDLKTGDKNEYQDKLYQMGKKVNTFLLEKAKGTNITKYFIPNIVCPLSDGDVAIALFIDINKIDDNVFISTLVNEEIKEEYNTIGASIWWNWLHRNIKNREWIIARLKEIEN